MRRSTLFVLALVPALVAGRAAAGEEAEKPATPAAAEAAEKTPSRSEEELAELRKKTLAGLADKNPKTRIAAAEAIVIAWPSSTLILDAALTSEDANVRFEATCLLRRAELGDVRDRIRARVSDSDARVRMHAVRAARLLEWPEIEPDLVRIVEGDASWLVIQEALRGLEDRGSAACLQVVFGGWTREHNDDRRPRFKRVLLKLLKNDYGDDIDKWRTAIEKAEIALRLEKAMKGGKADAKPEKPAAPASR